MLFLIENPTTAPLAIVLCFKRHGVIAHRDHCEKSLESFTVSCDKGVPEQLRLY